MTTLVLYPRKSDDLGSSNGAKFLHCEDAKQSFQFVARIDRIKRYLEEIGLLDHRTRSTGSPDQVQWWQLDCVGGFRRGDDSHAVVGFWREDGGGWFPYTAR